MILFHGDVEIQFGFEVIDIKNNGAHTNSNLTDARLVHGVVVCNGMGDPKTDSFALDHRSTKLIW